MSFESRNLNQNPYLKQKGNAYLKQYHTQQIQTASPEKILILLYDGAIQFVNKAKIALEKNDIAETHNNIVGCENIILEFMNTLDMELGGDLAKNLYSLYEFLYHTLVKANIKHDMEKLDLVLHHLTELRKTWQQAIDIANQEKKMEYFDEEAPTVQSEDDGDDYTPQEYEG